MRTKYYQYNNSSSDSNAKDKDKLNDALAKAVAMNKRIRSCSCGSLDIEYQGAGKYLCKACQKEMFDNYGKIRQCVTDFGAVSLTEVMQKTGLTRAEIDELARDGSINIISGSINIF